MKFPIPRFLAIVTLLTLAACAPTKNFCPVDVRIDYKEALLLAQKSELAYLPDSLIRRSCATDSCFIAIGPATGARAYLQTNVALKTQWIAFRGTQTLDDVQIDARYTQNRDSVLGIFLHRGFAEAANELMPQIAPRLLPGYDIVLTGHSLGGAVAAVALLQLQKDRPDARAVTFGQPKVTNIEGARLYSSANLTRFVNGRDVVPLVPPVDWKPGGNRIGSFAHFGREVLVGDSTAECLTRHYVRNLDPEEWKGQARAQSALDHLIVNYIGKLNKLQ